MAGLGRRGLVGKETLEKILLAYATRTHRGQNFVIGVKEKTKKSTNFIVKLKEFHRHGANSIWTWTFHTTCD